MVSKAVETIEIGVGFRRSWTSCVRATDNRTQEVATAIAPCCSFEKCQWRVRALHTFIDLLVISEIGVIDAAWMVRYEYTVECKVTLSLDRAKQKNVERSVDVQRTAGICYAYNYVHRVWPVNSKERCFCYQTQQ